MYFFYKQFVWRYATADSFYILFSVEMMCFQDCQILSLINPLGCNACICTHVNAVHARYDVVSINTKRFYSGRMRALLIG